MVQEMENDSESDYRHKLISLLSKLGMASLSDHIGTEKVRRLMSSVHTLDTHTLAEILILENGMNVFRNKNIRFELLASFGGVYLKEELDLKNPIFESLRDYNEFSWGNNARTKSFLQLLDLPGEKLFSRKAFIKSYEEIQLKRCLHPYQNWIRKSLVKFLSESEKSRVLVHMPTGSGKTRTTLEAVCDHIRYQDNRKISVVWLAHSEELCEQAVESFVTLWKRLGTENMAIVRLWGGAHLESLTIEKPTFIVTSFQTAYSMLMTSNDQKFALTSKIRSSCSLLVVDEAHQSTAPTYKDAIELLSNKKSKIVGLTATPGRHHVNQDSDDTKKLAKFYQSNKIDIVDDDGLQLDDPIEYLTDKGVLANLTRYRIDSGSEIELTEAEQKQMLNLLDIPSSVLKKLGKDEKRTNLIAAQAIKLAIEKSFPTIIFAPSKENSIELATLLMLKGCDAAAITADTPKYERKEMIDDFKRGELPVLVNYGVLTTGFDAPNIKAVIIGRPTTSVVLYSQMIGRGLRGPLMGGENECILVDVIDNLMNMPDANQSFTFFDQFYN